MNYPSYFEIQATDIQQAIKFYSTVFGWTFTRDTSIPIEYYRIGTGPMMGWLLARPAKTPPKECGTNAFCCSMQVQNFDAWAETILANGGTVAMPKFAVPGKCWQGYFLDPDNNTFGIYQVDTNAA